MPSFKEFFDRHFFYFTYFPLMIGFTGLTMLF